MKISVRARPGAKMATVRELTGILERSGARRFLVAVKEVAKEGKANRAIEKALAEYFGIASARVRIVSGQTSREKIIEVGE